VELLDTTNSHLYSDPLDFEFTASYSLQFVIVSRVYLNHVLKQFKI